MKIRLAALVLVSLAALALIVSLAGKSPGEAAGVLLKGAFGSASARSGTLDETTPLLLAAVAVFLALRAGLFNIGVEGQFLLGAAAATAVALASPPVLAIPLAILGAMGAGALWALPAAWIRAYRNGHEVITTIMLNAVAVSLTDWLVAGPLKAAGAGSPTSSNLPPSARLADLPSFGGGHVINVGLIVALVTVPVLALFLSRRVAGYELQAVGANPGAAEFAGVAVARTRVRAMLLSGGIAGLAGAIQVLAYEGRFYQGFSPGYGFDALGVALLAAGSAWLLVPAALLFGALAQGGTQLDIFGVPKGITVVVLGMVILVTAALRYRHEGGRE